MITVSRRCLNRTLLERQFLTGRTDRSAHAVISQLVALQAQEPNWPYVGLWSRLEGFRREDLFALVHERSVVRASMLRRTMHLAVADDFRWLRPTVQPVVQVALKHAYFADEIGGMDLDEVALAGRKLLTGRTLTRRELGRLLAERFPGRHAGRLADTVEVMLALVHAPATSAWGGWGTRSGIAVTLAQEWIGRPMLAPQLETMVLRYLAAFGPAGVMDIQAWSGLTRLSEVVDRLRPKLRVFRTEGGMELYDLPEAPLADQDRPVPVRFLPAFDNALLGHRDRTRVISDEDRRRFARVASAGVPMYLVDGFVHGTWSLQGSTLLIAPLRPLTKADAAAVEEEAKGLLGFIAPDATDRATAFVANSG
jgi:hypothetical protein